MKMPIDEMNRVEKENTKRVFTICINYLACACKLLHQTALLNIIDWVDQRIGGRGSSQGTTLDPPPMSTARRRSVAYRENIYGAKMWRRDVSLQFSAGTTALSLHWLASFELSQLLPHQTAHIPPMPAAFRHWLSVTAIFVSILALHPLLSLLCNAAQRLACTGFSDDSLPLLAA